MYRSYRARGGITLRGCKSSLVPGGQSPQPHEAQVILVVPIWKGGYPALLGMLLDFPRKFPQTHSLIHPTGVYYMLRVQVNMEHYVF